MYILEKGGVCINLLNYFINYQTSLLIAGYSAAYNYIILLLLVIIIIDIT